MKKYAGLFLALFLSTFPSAFGQDEASSQLPTIKLSLPTEVSSAAAQINYFMTGSFGGYGKFFKAAAGLTTYEIAASLDGKPATNVKIVAYFPGCEIQTLEVKVQPDIPTQSLICKPIEHVTLRGQVSPDSIAHNQPVEISVDYLALWAQDFFGVKDGMVMSIHVGTAVPAPDGSFEVEVPDFSNQSKPGEAAFQLTLRETKTGNILAQLKPVDETGNASGLEVRSDYPEVIRFTTDKH